MKTLKFETSKGKFIVVEGIDVSVHGATFVAKLSEITEEQAESIIRADFVYNPNDGSDYGDIDVYQDFTDEENYFYSATESLHSLLKSKSIHLFENPFNIENCFEPDYYEKKLQAEEKTFYNPYIFKL